MRTKLIAASFIILMACSYSPNPKTSGSTMNFSEKEILDKLDLAFRGIPAADYPAGRPQDIKYNFFLDLEHGYCETAGSRIHVYADKNRWAIVFEKCGYQNRGGRAEIELHYAGNCIDYPVDKYEERDYITNTSSVILITSEEYERIRNKQGEGLEDFELISPDVTHLNIHGQQVAINHDTTRYAALGIHPREHDNPQKLIGFGGIVRYFSDTNPSLVSATDQEIRQHIPMDIPKLMTLDKFHFVSAYDKNNPPSTQETYQLIAKILVTGDTSLWKPTLKPNNHWSNWKSGNL